MEHLEECEHGTLFESKCIHCERAKRHQQEDKEFFQSYKRDFESLQKDGVVCIPDNVTANQFTGWAKTL